MLLAILMLVSSCSCALAVDEGFASTYTYNYDYWSDIRESPDAYRVVDVLYGKDIAPAQANGEEGTLNAPQSMFVRGQDLYVVDSGNNRILQLNRDKVTGQFSLVREIKEFKATDGTAVTTFSNPTDVSVDVDGNIYVADNKNERIVKLDKDLNLLMTITKPDDTTFDQNLSFLPNKLVVDTTGRVFTLATMVNKGVVKFENDGTFTGYVGANKVSYSLYDYIWKTFFMTKEQRAQQESFVPTEYCNIYMDEDSFIYATNISFSEYDLLWDVAQPIRRLNAVGNDILIKNDHYPPIGDLYWEDGAVDYHGPSKFMDITVLENDIYVGLDRTRGRLFGYDSQGIMLWAFGNQGSSEGTFNNNGAIALDHMGRDLLVLDQRRGSITVFSPTEYGNLIYDAIGDYSNGKFEESAEKWQQVLDRNANYNLAFIGIGRALMREDTYESYIEAMDYFKMAQDRDNYGRAFQLFRKIWVERNIGWMMIVLAVIIVIPLILRQIKKRKMEVEAYERNQVAK